MLRLLSCFSFSFSVSLSFHPFFSNTVPYSFYSIIVIASWLSCFSFLLCCLRCVYHLLLPFEYEKEEEMSCFLSEMHMCKSSAFLILEDQELKRMTRTGNILQAQEVNVLPSFSLQKEVLFALNPFFSLESISLVRRNESREKRHFSLLKKSLSLFTTSPPLCSDFCCSFCLSLWK